MARQTPFLFLLIFFLAASCGNETKSDVSDGPGAFSYKNGHVAFTYFKNNTGSVYYTTNIDSVAKRLTFPATGWDLVYDLSQDLTKVLYVSYPNADYRTSHVCLYDLELGKTDTLIKQGQIITDACISQGNKYVYFLRASEINNYSPMAPSLPHGFDIYEVNVQTKSVRKLTNLNAYGIQALTLTPSDSTIAANIYDTLGLVKVSTITGTLSAIEINSPRNPVKESFYPIDIRLDSILYEAPYELYKHDLRNDLSEFILRSPSGGHFGAVQADNSWTNILFNSGEKMYSYNLPMKKLTEVRLKVE